MTQVIFHRWISHHLLDWRATSFCVCLGFGQLKNCTATNKKKFINNFPTLA